LPLFCRDQQEPHWKPWMGPQVHALPVSINLPQYMLLVNLVTCGAGAWVANF